MVPKDFKENMKLSLLAMLSITAKDMLDPDYYSECWKGIITDQTMVDAIENDKLYHEILETYLYGMYAQSVTRGIIHIYEENL